MYTDLLENSQVVFNSWSSEQVFIIHPSNSNLFSSQWISFYSTMILFSLSLRLQPFLVLSIYSKPFTTSFSTLKPERFFRAYFSLSILCFYHTLSHPCPPFSFLLEKNLPKPLPAPPRCRTLPADPHPSTTTGLFFPSHTEKCALPRLRAPISPIFRPFPQFYFLPCLF